ncbi:MAG: GNAT family N-acetyltransferase [Bacteroidetes bacterium]|nr:GNAT family N-acetyltransferase [Bacteroidota bacterium]
MDIEIVKAKKEEMSSVLQLITELAVFEKEPNAVQISEEDLMDAGFGESPMFTCFVAKINKEIVGMALIYFRFSTWVGKTVHLEDLVVKEKMRGKGIGDALYKGVMQYAKDEGVKRVNWMVLGWNEGAIKFYRRTGAVVMDEWWQVEMDEAGIDRYLEKY